MTEPASGEGSSPEPVILPTSVPQVEAPVVEVPEPSAGMLPSMELEVPTAPVVEIPVAEVLAAEVESVEVSPLAPASTPVPASTAVPAAALDIKSRQPAAREKVQARTRARLEKIIELARKKRTIKNDDVEMLLKVSDATASRYLSQLVREGRLRRLGKQKQPTYESV